MTKLQQAARAAAEEMGAELREQVKDSARALSAWEHLAEVRTAIIERHISPLLESRGDRVGLLGKEKNLVSDWRTACAEELVASLNWRWMGEREIQENIDSMSAIITRHIEEAFLSTDVGWKARKALRTEIKRQAERIVELEGAFGSIIVRCVEGDKRVDWLPKIERIARAALAPKEVDDE